MDDDLFSPGRIWEQFRLLVPMHYCGVIPEWDELPEDVQRAFAKPIDDLRYIVKMALKDISRQL